MKTEITNPFIFFGSSRHMIENMFMFAGSKQRIAGLLTCLPQEWHFFSTKFDLVTLVTSK